ncbi:MAG: OmpA family protein [Myxococcota bacterium]
MEMNQPTEINARRPSVTPFVTALLIIAGILMPSLGSASPREDTIEVLRAVQGGASGEGVRVFVNQGDGGPLRIGDELAYRFESNRTGYLTAVHVDMHGSTTLLYPRMDVSAGRVEAGRTVDLPSRGDGFTLEVQPPVGQDTVYAVVTAEPITRGELGISDSDVVVSFEPHEGPAFVRRLRSVLNGRPADAIRVAHVVQQIQGRGAVQYRSADIVGFFGERTRSIRPAKLDLQIQFGTNSATLNDSARRNIDEFARALKDPKLRDMRFNVAGHTDDRGTNEHNLSLSERRANTVRGYLVEQGGIDPGRLEIEAHGEKNPLMNEQSDYARSMNRRVEFTPIR